MARYRKVSTIIWNDEKFRTLSDKAQLVFFFVLTHPHMTSLGAMRGTVDGLAAEHKKWPAEAFREAFMEVFRKGLLEVDEEASFIGLPKFLKHNPPESPNVVKSWEKCWDDIPECKLKDKLSQRVKGFVEGLGKGFREAYGKGFRKGMPYQEQEQEQEQEYEQEQEQTNLTPPLSSAQSTNGKHPPLSESELKAGGEELLIAVGVSEARAAIHAFAANGGTMAELEALIAFWSQNLPAWGPGALANRVMAWRTGQSVSTHWPGQSAEVVRQRSRDETSRNAEKLRNLHAGQQAERAADLERKSHLEAKYGSYLDTMPDKQVRAFTSNACGDEAGFLLSLYKGGPPKGMHREALLTDLERSGFVPP